VTLPAGVVAQTILPSAPGEPVALGLMPTGSIEVQLVPAADELGRRPEGKLEDLAVIAKDDRGAEWYLRADSTGRIRFGAIPPGRYSFTFDFTGTTERLRQIGDPVVLEVKPGLNVPPLEIRFAPRAARLFNGGQGSTTGQRRR
jgi:hypothetical protein